MDRTLNRLPALAIVLALMIPTLACGPTSALSAEDKAAGDLKYWAKRQYEQEASISAEERNTYNTMQVTSVKKASGESHEIMAQMILKGQGQDSDLDAYQKVELVEVKMPNGELKTGVKTTSKAKGVEFHFPDN